MFALLSTAEWIGFLLRKTSSRSILSKLPLPNMGN
uniref:Uncharacterized protein n=1 Tax=Rhizophora mucronata TaxID=61149 RepID=A0A2P2MRI3_RHIMU